MCQKKSLTEIQVNRFLQLAVDPEVDLTKKCKGSANTALLTLVRYNNSESLLPVLKKLVEFEEVRGQINVTNKLGYNALLSTCRYFVQTSTINCVRLLVNLGINVNAKVKSTNGTSAIEFLCDKYNGGNLVDIARLLLYNKCDLDDASKAVDLLRNRNLRRDADVLLKIIESLRQNKEEWAQSQVKPMGFCNYLLFLLLI